MTSPYRQHVNIILNPYANRWRAQQKIPAIQAALDAAGLSYEFTLTTEPQHATAAAHAAIQRFDAIVAAGGDGTVNEVVNALVRASGNSPTHPLGVLPIGTGNDFSDMAQLPRELGRAAAAIARGHTRQIDIGRVNDHYFDNNCALAMEPLVTIENVKIKRISGTLRYVVALIKALVKLKAWHMHIQWDDGEHQGPIYLLSVCNSPRTGALFYMAPDAAMDDGLFDVILAPELSKWEVLSILPRFFKGTHIRHPKVKHFRTTSLTVQSSPGTPIHADGEVLSASAESVRYEILPGKLTLIVP